VGVVCLVGEGGGGGGGRQSGGCACDSFASKGNADLCVLVCEYVCKSVRD